MNGNMALLRDFQNVYIQRRTPLNPQLINPGSFVMDELKDNVVSLYERKVNNMSDGALISECMIFLHALENNALTPENKHRALILFKAASERKGLETSRNDFLIALRVLRHL